MPMPKFWCFTECCLQQFFFLYLSEFIKRKASLFRKNIFPARCHRICNGSPLVLFFYSIKVSNVSIALSCLSLSTLFASILEPIIFKRKVDVSEVVMGVVIVACILMIFKTEFHFKEGIIYGIFCAVFGTVFSVFNGKMFGKTSSGNIIFYEIFCGWFILMLFYLFSGQIIHMNEINYRDLALICLLASVFTAFPMLESVKLMKYISPFTLILTVNLEPVYGIILAFFYLWGIRTYEPYILYCFSSYDTGNHSERINKSQEN